MGQINVIKCPIEGLFIIEPAVHGDSRGYFMETNNQSNLRRRLCPCGQRSSERQHKESEVGRPA